MIRINLPHPKGCRHPINKDDFGDVYTIKLNLKSRDPNAQDQFGIYLGDNKVGVKDLMTSKIIKTITYNTPEEMHSVWILD